MKFELHRTTQDADSEVIAESDRLSDCVRAWEDHVDHVEDEGIYVVLNTELDEIVWKVSAKVHPHDRS